MIGICPRFAVQDPFVKLMTGAMRLPVIYHRMRVGMLAAVNHVETINRALGSLMIHLHADVMPREGRAKVRGQSDAFGRVFRSICTVVKHVGGLTALRFSHAARTRDRSTGAEHASGCVGLQARGS